MICDFKFTSFRLFMVAMTAKITIRIFDNKKDLHRLKIGIGLWKDQLSNFEIVLHFGSFHVA